MKALVKNKPLVVQRVSYKTEFNYTGFNKETLYVCEFWFWFTTKPCMPSRSAPKKRFCSI